MARGKYTKKQARINRTPMAGATGPDPFDIMTLLEGLASGETVVPTPVQQPFSAAQAAARSGVRPVTRNIPNISAASAANRASAGRGPGYRPPNVVRPPAALPTLPGAGPKTPWLGGWGSPILMLAASIFGPQIIELALEAAGVGPRSKEVELQRELAAADRKAKKDLLGLELRREGLDKADQREADTRKMNLMATLAQIQAGRADNAALRSGALGGVPRQQRLSESTIDPNQVVYSLMSDSDIPAEAMGLI